MKGERGNRREIFGPPLAQHQPDALCKKERRIYERAHAEFAQTFSRSRWIAEQVRAEDSDCSGQPEMRWPEIHAVGHVLM